MCVCGHFTDMQNAATLGHGWGHYSDNVPYVTVMNVGNKSLRK